MKVKMRSRKKWVGMKRVRRLKGKIEVGVEVLLRERRLQIY